MQISFRNPHEAVESRVLERAERRLQKLHKLVDESKVESQVFVEIGKATGSHHSGDVWQSSINLDRSGERYNASAVGNTPERAMNRAMDELKAELRKMHARDKSLRRRQGSLWKSIQNTFRP